MEEMKKYILGDVCSRLSSGKGISSEEVLESGPFPVIGGNGLRGYSLKSNFSGECGVIGRQGAYCGNVRYFSGEAYMTEHAVVVVGNEMADTRYLTYLLSTMHLGNLSAQSAQPGLSVKTLAKQEIMLPSLSEQKRRASILASLEDKIALNNRINHNLEEQALALYKSWFEEDIEYRHWPTTTLSAFFNVITGKKDANFSTPDGQYPFFTCSQVPLRAPSYSFDGKAILMAGNGDFNVKRFIGRFEAYQRTYVLMPYEDKYLSFLFLLMKVHLGDITGGSRGSVIKFITKGNIADYSFRFPSYNIDDKLDVLNSFFAQIDEHVAEIEQLSSLRDQLIPKLIDGAFLSCHL